MNIGGNVMAIALYERLFCRKMACKNVVRETKVSECVDEGMTVPQGPAFDGSMHGNSVADENKY
jgi:hypothetical protein